jgi:broad specificity phosphatase PhoE
MLGECDHGLSDEGRAQAEQLRETLSSIKIKLQHGFGRPGRPGAVPQQAWATPDYLQRPWLERVLEPDAIVSSPFTRAMQTAIISLSDILETKGTLKVSTDVREVKTTMASMDSTGSLKGEELREHLAKELRLFYDSEPFAQRVSDVLARIDLTSTNCEWWSDSADSQDDVKLRMDAFLNSLFAGRDGSSTVLVGHSVFFKLLFRWYISEEIPGDVAESVRTINVPNCSLLGLKLEDDGKCRCISEVVPLLDLKLASAGVPQMLFPLPPSRCCLPDSKGPQDISDWKGEGEDAYPSSDVRRSQPRTCILSACNGSRLFG